MVNHSLPLRNKLQISKTTPLFLHASVVENYPMGI